MNDANSQATQSFVKIQGPKLLRFPNACLHKSSSFLPSTTPVLSLGPNFLNTSNNTAKMHSHRMLALTILPLLVNAHFHVLFPRPRSDDESTSTGPCGGFPVSDSRTQVSVRSFPVALEMGHDRSVIQMILALGNDPGDNFNITLEQTFQQQGEGGFCLPDVAVPESARVTEGMNGTLQVVTDGEGGGGLYVVS